MHPFFLRCCVTPSLCGVADVCSVSACVRVCVGGGVCVQGFVCRGGCVLCSCVAFLSLSRSLTLCVFECVCVCVCVCVFRCCYMFSNHIPTQTLLLLRRALIGSFSSNPPLAFYSPWNSTQTYRTYTLIYHATPRLRATKCTRHSNKQTLMSL